jgi:hypothetical protein
MSLDSDADGERVAAATGGDVHEDDRLTLVRRPGRRVVPAGDGAQCLGGDEGGFVGAPFGQPLGASGLLVPGQGVVDDPLIQERVHHPRCGLPHEHAIVILAVVSVERLEHRAGARVGRRDHAKHPVRGGQAGAHGAEHLDGGIRARLIGGPVGALVADEEGQGATTRGADGRRGDFDGDACG